MRKVGFLLIFYNQGRKWCPIKEKLNKKINKKGFNQKNKGQRKQSNKGKFKMPCCYIDSSYLKNKHRIPFSALIKTKKNVEIRI